MSQYITPKTLCGCPCTGAGACGGMGDSGDGLSGIDDPKVLTALAAGIAFFVFVWPKLKGGR